jgi:glyoxylase-like metal-dependent hydrolase (beta-lactamase superfamily II)
VANPPAIELVPGVFRIPTVGSWQINSYAFVDDDGSVTLVDTGLRSAPPKLVTGLAAMGLRVVATPGHSPGHISLLQERSRVLVTGTRSSTCWACGSPRDRCARTTG